MAYQNMTVIDLNQENEKLPRPAVVVRLSSILLPLLIAGGLLLPAAALAFLF